MTLGDEIREMTKRLADTTHSLSKELDNDIFMLAAKADRMEGNLHYLAQCVVADAEQEVERRHTAAYILSRKHTLLDALSRALAGFPIWQFPVTRERVLAESEEVKAKLATRLGKVRHDRAK